MRKFKILLIGFIIGLIIGIGFGINIGKDRSLLSNPFAGSDLKKTIKKTSGEVIEKGGKALEKSGKALQEELKDNFKK